MTVTRSVVKNNEMIPFPLLLIQPSLSPSRHTSPSFFVLFGDAGFICQPWCSSGSAGEFISDTHLLFNKSQEGGRQGAEILTTGLQHDHRHKHTPYISTPSSLSLLFIYFLKGIIFSPSLFLLEGATGHDWCVKKKRKKAFTLYQQSNCINNTCKE